jgi:hypothetical protein
MAPKKLKNLFKKMSENEVPNWLDVMSAISDVTNLVTLTERPPAPAEPRTICELNGRNCCSD